MLNGGQYRERILELARKLEEGETLTPEEKAEFDQWYEAFDDTRMPALAGETPEVLRQRLYAEIMRKGRIQPKVGKTAPMRQYWTAAAAIVLLVGGLTLVYIMRTPRPLVVMNDRPAVDTVIAPGGNKAVLTLANGTKMILDSAKNGLLAMQGGMGVVKKDDGAISYERDGSVGERGGLLYNTVATPKGGQYVVTLPDGTRVWLNATSSIRFPTAFTGAERLVQIRGEAYLEVAPDRTKPFRVAVVYANGEKQMEVEVLGTQFNVMAYEEEGAVKTTLLEGAVRLVHGAETKVLRPGQQGELKDDVFRLMSNADTSAAVAWKNGQDRKSVV